MFASLSSKFFETDSPSKYRNLSRLLTKPTKWYVRPAKTQISLGIRPVWSVFAVRWMGRWGHNFFHADSEDSDQTGRMPRLIWIFAGRKGHFVGFVMRWLIWFLWFVLSMWLTIPCLNLKDIQIYRQYGSLLLHFHDLICSCSIVIPKCFFFFYLGFTARQNYFTPFGRVNHKAGRKREIAEKKKHLTTSQAELGLSHMWPELGSNPQWWDGEWLKALKISDLNHSATGAAWVYLFKFNSIKAITSLFCLII